MTEAEPVARRTWVGRRYLFRVGGRPVASYTVTLYLGCVAGVFAGAAVASATGLDESRVAMATIGLLVPALAGARLLYVLVHLDRFRAEPRLLWRRTDGGSALYGGLILSIAVSVPVLARWHLPFWAFWDAASVTMLVGLIVTRFGCLANGCCAGRVTTGRLGLWLPGQGGRWERRIPTQLLEAGWAAVVLAGALAVRADLPFTGDLFALVVAAYATGRLLLEPLREGDGGSAGRTTNLAISAALLAAAAAILAVRG